MGFCETREQRFGIPAIERRIRVDLSGEVADEGRD